MKRPRPIRDSSQYLNFAAERTQPAVDRTARIAFDSPARAIDLGCGPGNSTAVLARRRPSAALAGLDSSPAMIAAARKDFPQWNWPAGDIAAWTAPTAAPFDVVFSNAALQWIPDHARVLPRLFAQLPPRGALAFQGPANLDAPAHRIMRELGASAAWRDSFRATVREWHVHEPSFPVPVAFAPVIDDPPPAKAHA